MKNHRTYNRELFGIRTILERWGRQNARLKLQWCHVWLYLEAKLFHVLGLAPLQNLWNILVSLENRE
jgi:hypothetical protein